ncbi:MipA/OmpV family protein [Roseateles sp.]|uniref:MipA/OmpV family protein n=1 Tax=Roseateles sp. TaxID=1971397 RepID=UPI0025E5AD5A|nr:MipA/OmpV family protein [Roseateles sp.]MBV8033686.1 MipA/OmpV family protein [Roseateles sp.]
MKLLFLLSGLSLATLPPGASAADAPSPAKDSTLTVGAGLGVAPPFMGSKENQVVFAPLLDYQHESGFFASTQRGLGWGGGSDALKFSLALSGRGERTDKPGHVLGAGGGSKELRGMGSVKASVLGLAGVSLRLGERAELSATAELPLTQRNNGGALHLGGHLLLLQQGQQSLSLGATLNYGDRKYLRTYFGVTPQQSQDSGYAAYTPKAGFYKADLTLLWTLRLDEHWGITAAGGMGRLLGEAAKSPLARRRTAPEGGVMLTYTY